MGNISSIIRIFAINCGATEAADKPTGNTKMQLAPIVLFTYNRPDHTRRTLDSLKANFLADQSELHIYCDGPKERATQADLDRIKAVRQLIREENWTAKVYIKEAESNKGLARSIIDGVTEVVEKHGRVIVLEDDLELSPGFLKYMNDALEFYQDEERVMHVSGYMFPVKAELPETFFYNITSCWGWATWSRSWKHLNEDARFLYKTLKKKKLLHKFNFEGSSDQALQLYSNIDGNLNTWAVKWYASVFLQNGFCLHPGQTMVRNIGFDDLGTHTNKSSLLAEIERLGSNIEVGEIEIEESKVARELVKKLFNSKNKLFIIRSMYRYYSKSMIVRWILSAAQKFKKLINNS